MYSGDPCSFCDAAKALLKTKKVTNLSLPDKFIFENTGRSNLLDINGLSIQNIRKNILNLI